MIIRQSAFTGENEKLLKGGLHCHTTRSDGKVEPGDCIRLHAANGYDFLALTDHRYYNYTNFAPETDVLIIPGMEMDGSLKKLPGMCFHTVSLGPDDDTNGFKQDDRFDSARVTNQYEYQPVIDMLKAKNNLVFYCHPDWSCTPARVFENLKGCFAMEIWNSGCVIETGTDIDNGIIWDELLVSGKKINCVAVDDGHQPEHHCKGWVRVNAQKNVSSILNALENGAYYSSCGPEIYDFYIEDGVAHVKCSPCSMIHFINGVRPTRLNKAQDSLLTEASIPIAPSWNFVRVVVEDEQGRRAWSNPLYLERSGEWKE